MNAARQRLPVLAIKPDGTQLFIAWYDRRNDTNNSLIDVYGKFGTIETNGTIGFGTEFRISTVSFPPVFAGTLTANRVIGHYDPVYPPDQVNLNWWYADWPGDTNVLTQNAYIDHVGEYNGVAADSHAIYITWTDSRLRSPGQTSNEPQRDIRLLRLAWP